jgi:hypothetical protein
MCHPPAAVPAVHRDEVAGLQCERRARFEHCSDAHRGDRCFRSQQPLAGFGRRRGAQAGTCRTNAQQLDDAPWHVLQGDHRCRSL